ncbi:MAG TPA: hypothetical protein VG738_09180 [Chitinophagaceae bacterium]|nr:hypothetical protein [Chitinophagaceae bacterium]
MTLYDKYLNGQTREVYQDIEKLGDKAFSDFYFNDIEKVLTETFERTAYNLAIIYKDLQQINYLFKTAPKNNYEKPLHSPLPNTDALLKQLDRAVKPFGYVPLSLKFFYKIVGGVNFGWDYNTNEDYIWNLADPVQIASLDAVIETVTDKYWVQEIKEYVDDEDFGVPFLDLSADYLHKDNISGGPAYALQITNRPGIDSKFLNEPNNTTFIDYLRICFYNCGFPGIKRPELQNDYLHFFDRVRPQIKQI